jgi:hypothetical protein
MSLALTVQAVHHQLRTKQLYLIATPTGNYVTGGDTVNLQAITPRLGQEDAQVGFPGIVKESEVSSAPAGYAAVLIPGTTLNNWKLKIYSVAGTELAAAAYPAAILAGVFILFLEGPKGRI